MAKTRFFCVAVEGATTDGRAIERSWIQEMADTYNPSTYGARVNMEHIRGFSPEPPFNAYGDVLALEAREIEVELGGKTVKKLGLFAQLEANDQLLAINAKGQKLYSSIEVNPNFAGTGKAYLMGLAVTDSPASLGTEMLKFAASAKASPLAGRKQDKSCLFTAADEQPISIDLDAATSPNAPAAESALDKFAAAIAKFIGGETPKEEPKEEPKPAPAAAPDNQGFAAALAGFTAAVQADRAADKAAADRQFGELKASIGELKTALETTPNKNHSARPAASGGDDRVLTDC